MSARSYCPPKLTPALLKETAAKGAATCEDETVALLEKVSFPGAADAGAVTKG